MQSAQHSSGTLSPLHSKGGPAGQRRHGLSFFSFDCRSRALLPLCVCERESVRECVCANHLTMWMILVHGQSCRQRTRVSCKPCPMEGKEASIQLRFPAFGAPSWFILTNILRLVTLPACECVSACVCACMRVCVDVRAWVALRSPSLPLSPPARCLQVHLIDLFRHSCPSLTLIPRQRYLGT